MKYIIGIISAVAGLTAAAVTPVVDEATGNVTLHVESDETYAGVIAGEGITVTKTGAGTLTLSGANTFTGTLLVKEGMLVAAPANTAGKPALVVKNGASFKSAGGGSLWGYDALNLASVTIEGAGVEGKGAFIRSSGNICKSDSNHGFLLTGDATINFAIVHNPGIVKLNGYTLTKIGSGEWYSLCAQKYVPDGDGGKGKIVIQQGVVKVQNYIFAQGSAENVLELKNGTSLYTVSQSKNSVCPWTLRVSGNATVYDETASGTASHVKWAGPLEVAGGNLTLNHTSAATTIEFSGPVATAAGCRLLASRAGINKFSGKTQVLAGPIGRTDYEEYGQFDFAGEVKITHADRTYLNGSQATPQKMTIADSVWDGQSDLMHVASRASSWAVAELQRTVVTNAFRVGAYYTSGNAGYGALYQVAGELFVPKSGNATADRFTVANGPGVGYFRKSGGSLKSDVEFELARVRGFASAYFDGGAAEFNLPISMSRGRNDASLTADQSRSGESVYYQTGAATNRVPGINIGPQANEPIPSGGSALVAVEGEGTVFSVYGTAGYYGLRLQAPTALDAVLAVNDGATLSASRIVRLSSPSEKTDVSFVMSVDGGNVEITQANLGNGMYPPEKMLVQNGGMTFTASATPSVAWPAAFEAPVGKIVSSVALPTEEAFLADQGKYIGPAKVTIAGTGCGAAAIALFDKDTRKITGVRVVSPGTGYDETTTATIESPDRSSVYVCAVTLADAPVTGAGFVKRGAGAYTFEKANTYKGTTAVEEGTLVFAHEKSLPEDSGLSISGGATADFNGRAVTVPTLSGGNGTVTDLASLTVTDALSLTMASNATLKVDAQLTLADGAVLTLPGSLSDLSENRSNILLQATGGIVCAGRVELPSLPSPWKVEIRAKDIYVRRVNGTVMILR